MAKFTYKARDKNGKISKGILNAEDRKAALVQLKQKELKPIDLKSDEIPLVGPLLKKLSDMQSVPMKEKVIFSRQLAAIINAGIPLVEALSLIQGQTANAKLKKIIGMVLTDIQAGQTFADALARHQGVFSELFINVVRAGEVSGTLDTSLISLADQIQKDHEVQGKIRGALILPLMVLLVIIGVIILMSVLVIPQLADMFNEAGAELPLPTRIMMGLSYFLTNYWWLAIILTVGVSVALTRFFASPQGKSIMDVVVLKVPVFGQLLKLVIYTRFTKVLSLLLKSGVPLLRSLDIIADLVGNKIYRESLKRVAKKVEVGVPLATGISEEPHFPAIIHQMIGIGEQTGSMDNMLQKLAVMFQEESDNMIKNLTTLLEPMLMLVMGGAVTFIVMAVLMPIYGLVNVVG